MVVALIKVYKQVQINDSDCKGVVNGKTMGRKLPAFGAGLPGAAYLRIHNLCFFGEPENISVGISDIKLLSVRHFPQGLDDIY